MNYRMTILSTHFKTLFHDSEHPLMAYSDIEAHEIMLS